ncbi:MAG: hypothetical protein NT070_16795 [Cyanobacteria bacterium]|nr:hypothetical protein [Cyanobacteriota bacterium]
MTDDKTSADQPTERSSLQRIETNYPTTSQQSSVFETYASAFAPHINNNKEFALEFLTQLLQDRALDRKLVDDRQRQEFDLRSKELDNKTKVETQRETRLTEESKSNKTTTRIVIGVVTFAFTAALGYGIVHKDSTLADKVFTGAMGLLGGAGGLAVLNQKKEQETDKK